MQASERGQREFAAHIEHRRAALFEQLDRFEGAAQGQVGHSAAAVDRWGRDKKTLKAVELLKKGCTAVFDVSGELPLPTLAGLHAASAAYDATGIRAVARPVERGQAAPRALWRVVVL